ncbi:MAG: hypothetical protein OEM81_10095 [Acidimicrobiia bacterium]|nr:hypothetical protein [Acidimicrobiia bacterium]
MRLIIVDLTNGLLFDEDTKVARAGAGDVLRALSRQYRLVAFLDTSRTGLELRGRLEEAGLGGFFEMVSTSADLGGGLSPSVVDSLTAGFGIPAGHVAVISNQGDVVDTLQMAGVVALLAEPDRPLSDLPEALAWLTAVSSG